jgi:putative phosphoribosyl transferase
MQFRNRIDAGRRLAEALGSYASRPDVVVLALPRGGVPVGYVVARALNAPLDVFVVRKLGVPGMSELAMGAIASGGTRVLNDEVVQGLGIPPETIDRVAREEAQELERRERLFRGARPAVPVEGRTVILVDDGLATGSTMKAAIQAVRRRHPIRIVVAVPVSAPETVHNLRELVDDLVVLEAPAGFFAVGASYDEFTQTTDGEVRELLDRAEREGSATGSR